MEPEQLQASQQDVAQIAIDSGHILLGHFETSVKQDVKSSDVDIVTDADRASEAHLVKALSQRYPTHHIVGEEGGGTGADATSAPYFWYVDPLDGTNNFASGIPHYSVSIALTDRQRVPLLGVVYDPARDELYMAHRGGEATLNGQGISVSETQALKQAIVASGFSYDKATNPDNNLRQWGNFMVRTRGIRRIGSAALDLCYVAAGRFDAYWERTLKPWDALAGMLIVQIAGGIVTDYQGGDAPQHDADGRYVASNGHLHQTMLEILAL